MPFLRQQFGPWLGLHDQYGPRPLALAQPAAAPSTTPIAVVTPSYNQGRFLDRTIRSVLDQDYPALEYVVQDGGSKDESPAVMERYRARLHHLESCRDKGQADAINRGFAHTGAEVMAYLNSDDLLLPGSLAYVGKFFADHPAVDVVYGHRVIIDEEDNDIGRWVLPPHEESAFCWNNYVPQETLFWRRRIWDAAGGRIDDNYHYALDWDMLLRFRAAGARFARVPRFLGAFRLHASQKSTADHAALGMPEMERVRRRLHGRAVSRWEARWRVLPYLCKHVVYQRLHNWRLLAG